MFGHLKIGVSTVFSVVTFVLKPIICRRLLIFSLAEENQENEKK